MQVITQSAAMVSLYTKHEPRCYHHGIETSDPTTVLPIAIYMLTRGDLTMIDIPLSRI
jgi:hypothetical protein